MAGWRETDTSEPIDKAPRGGVSELPGWNGSERTSSLVIDDSQGRACKQGAKAASLRLKSADERGGLGGVKAPAREQSVTEQLEKSSSPTGERPVQLGRSYNRNGKWTEGERMADGSAVAMKRGNACGAKGPCRSTFLQQKAR